MSAKQANKRPSSTPSITLVGGFESGKTTLLAYFFLHFSADPRAREKIEKEIEQHWHAHRCGIINVIADKYVSRPDERQYAGPSFHASKPFLIESEKMHHGLTKTEILELVQRQQEKYLQAKTSSPSSSSSSSTVTAAAGGSSSSLQEQEEENRKVDESFRRAFILRDTPSRYIKNVMLPLAHSDAAIVVVNAALGQFEHSFNLPVSDSKQNSKNKKKQSVMSNNSFMFSSQDALDKVRGILRDHLILTLAATTSQGGPRMPLIVLVNKMDEVNWSRKRFDFIRDTVSHFVHALNKATKVIFIPASIDHDVNLRCRGKATASTPSSSATPPCSVAKKKDEAVTSEGKVNVGFRWKNAVCGESGKQEEQEEEEEEEGNPAWYKAEGMKEFPCLLETIQSLPEPRRTPCSGSTASSSSPLRVSVRETMKIGGIGTVACVKILSGVLRPGDTITWVCRPATSPAGYSWSSPRCHTFISTLDQYHRQEQNSNASSSSSGTNTISSKSGSGAWHQQEVKTLEGFLENEPEAGSDDRCLDAGKSVGVCLRMVKRSDLPAGMIGVRGQDVAWKNVGNYPVAVSWFYADVALVNFPKDFEIINNGKIEPIVWVAGQRCACKMYVDSRQYFEKIEEEEEEEEEEVKKNVKRVERTEKNPKKLHSHDRVSAKFTIAHSNGGLLVVEEYKDCPQLGSISLLMSNRVIGIGKVCFVSFPHRPWTRRRVLFLILHFGKTRLSKLYQEEYAPLFLTARML